MSIAYTPMDLSELDHEPPPEEIINGIYYPSSDGVKMGEGDWHFTALTTLFSMLRRHYRHKPVYVAGDMMLYYEEGNPKAVRAPDVMVCLGVSSHRRASWLTWIEGKVPAVVFEIASKRTRSEDLGAKRTLYQNLGIPEYFAFDPVGDAFRSDRSRLRGWRLVDGVYQPIEPDDQGSMESHQLNMLLYLDGNLLRLLDLTTRLPLRDYGEQMDFTERELVRMRELRRSLDRSLLRKYRRRIQKKLDAQASTILGEAEAHRARAEEQARIAEAERLRADALAAELERLKAGRHEGNG